MRLGIRHRLLLVIVVAVAGALAALLLGFNLILGSTLNHDARALARTRAAAEFALLRSRHGRLTIASTPDASAADSSVWVFSRGITLDGPRASGQVSAAARALANGPARFTDVSTGDVRLYALPVVVSGQRVGTVVSSVSLAAYERTRRIALIASLILGVVVLVLVAFAAYWLLRSALQPVRRMTRQAAAWSERELDHRFALGDPHDELTELAATLDQLLDRLAASLRREQRFSAELSHELRTPLARVLAESELALRRDRTRPEYQEALRTVNRSAAQLTRTVDALVAASRHESGFVRGRADASDIAAEAVASLVPLASERGVELRLERPAEPVNVGVELELAERILQPVMENACRYGTSRVQVAVERESGSVVYVVEDDGPGVEESEQEQIFEPGRRGRLGLANGSDGAGLGLALARRLARGVGGEVEVATGLGHGRFTVTLPTG